MREHHASCMCLHLLIFVLPQMIRTSDPGIAAWYKSGHSATASGNLVSRMCLILLFFWCRKEDYSALRASPFGSPFGRSKWLRHFVEPTFCLSGVRMR